jgi:pentose-5-phosphate-3-epimerase
MEPQAIQQQIWEQVDDLLSYRIRTFHVDLNFDDYRGYGRERPPNNLAVFTPSFLERLNDLIRSGGGFLNLHLLTDAPESHLARLAPLAPGAICFQLEVVTDPGTLERLIGRITELGACASPVIETVGSEHVRPLSPPHVRALLLPLAPQLGMLTFQAAGTASRSNLPAGVFAQEALASYLQALPQAFRGTLQIQGGITTQTIGQAVQMGAEFLVCGTQLFRHPEGLSPRIVVDRMLLEAARVLSG